MAGASTDPVAGAEPVASPPVARSNLPELRARATALAATSGRALLGITGPPGAGKSTLAAELVSALGPRAALVPMDGFHLSNAVLRSLGRRGRKGAPDTFDAAGYGRLLARLREPTSDVVYAPDFDRELDEAVAAAIAVPPEVDVIVTEGNYLLLDDAPWPTAAAHLNAVWYLELDDEERRRRLVARHQRHGMSTHEARAWTEGTDEPNAVAVAAGRGRADLVVVGGTWGRS